MIISVLQVRKLKHREVKSPIVTELRSRVKSQHRQSHPGGCANLYVTLPFTGCQRLS